MGSVRERNEADCTDRGRPGDTLLPFNEISFAIFHLGFSHRVDGCIYNLVFSQHVALSEDGGKIILPNDMTLHHPNQTRSARERPAH